MSTKASNSVRGYASNSYPLAELIRPQPSILGLQAFLAVAQLGSLNKAANLLCRTQGAISRQIQQLEQHYQAAFFLRTFAGMQLTADGERFLKVSTEVLSLLTEHSLGLKATAETIHLQLPSTLALHWFLPKLDALQQLLPGITLAISTSVSDAAEFVADNIDAMIVRGSGEWPGMHSVELFPERLTPMCRPDLAVGINAPQDMTSQCLLHAGAGRREWQAWLAMAGIKGPCKQNLEFDCLEVALNAAAMGYGIAMGDPRMVQGKLATGELVLPFPQLFHHHLAYHLVVHEQRKDQVNIQQLITAVLTLA
ncbi:MAG TPA: LysR substrate-binding domain-containing protein [Burkholderiaceae bacterium]